MGQDPGLIRDNERSGAEVSGRRVQDLHGVLQLQLLVERNYTGLGSVVSDQDPAQKPVVELHEPKIRSQKMRKLDRRTNHHIYKQKNYKLKCSNSNYSTFVEPVSNSIIVFMK